jgi:hypothetical protein
VIRLKLVVTCKCCSRKEKALLNRSEGRFLKGIGVTGFEPATSWSRTKRPAKQNPAQDAKNAIPDAGGEARCSARCSCDPKTPSADPDLAAVVRAWPRLSAAIRAGVVAMIAAATEEGPS